MAGVTFWWLVGAGAGTVGAVTPYWVDCIGVAAELMTGVGAGVPIGPLAVWYFKSPVGML